jgi:nucleotide-binding universal stress UspA family protein
MIERVLVPLDGSQHAEQILPHVRRILHRNGSEVILVHAVVPPPVENGVMIADSLLARAGGYILGIQERLAQEGVRVKSVFRMGSAVNVILEVAQEVRATMLALTTHGETGLKRLLFGSIAESLMRKSSVPVFVARPFWSYDLLPDSGSPLLLPPIRNILLPLEGSPAASAILSPLIEFARLFDSRVVLLHVKDSGQKEDNPALEAKQEGLAILVECARSLEDQGVETLSLMEQGDPAQVILKLARSQKTDLIAMATHGRSGIDRLLQGSVTERVLHESTCPMLVVRAPDPADGKKRLLETRGIRK